MEYVFLYLRNIQDYFTYLGGAPEELAAGGTNCGAKNFLTHNDFVKLIRLLKIISTTQKGLIFKEKLAKERTPIDIEI